MYCAWRIHANLRCTQCSILLHLMDICFLTCICLWQISQIQTFLFKVVGPGLVSTSHAFVSSSTSQPAGPHKSGPHYWGRGGSTQFAQQPESAVTAPPLVDCVVWSLLFAMIRSVVKSFKVPDVEVVAAWMCNEAAFTHMTDSTPKKTWSYLTLVLDG